MLIAGSRRAAASGAWFDTENPFTGAAWARVARGTAEDVDAAVEAAHAAFRCGAWPGMTAADRGNLLLKLADLVDRDVERLARAEIRDNGKSIAEVRAQVKGVAAVYRYYGGLADKIEGSAIPVDDNQFLVYTRLEPLGVIVAITPWNSPLRLLSLKLGPALAAGNTVVVKPSEFTSTSTLEFMDLVAEAGFPAGVVNVVTGFGAEVGPALSTHPKVAKVSLTGGTDSGRKAYLAAAADLKTVTLELGGKSPNIVFADADLDRAAEGAAAGVFGSAGQTCIAGSRLLAHKDIAEALTTRIVTLAKARRLGDPSEEATEIGPVATRRQFEKILEYIAIAKGEGAELVTGGRQARGEGLGEGLFIEPTVFANVANTMRIAQEEVFGPVLSVIPFETEEEAIAIANDIPFGLAAALWTRDVARAHRVAAKLEAGTVWINTYRRNAPQVPVGGYKQSGIGRESGALAIKEFMQSKSVWVSLA
ncbi:aldehyde dehydrogenase [Xanthobacter dioxanivorans]|uniref:Aldehyde dehydrogenase n=1 Tax=Xanthobacter dioxanivorans TaxID=2528964 RepID=A0A974SLE7_9HYPH|nr:aldehyde dehydrogenase [Xanthobacter dioxanivorans]QRG09820.1 aldehyde dehydrogenase [Xanthobacter dioxanivorans]